jgi:uncharacterized repeat protein (TIGR01451 family)
MKQMVRLVPYVLAAILVGAPAALAQTAPAAPAPATAPPPPTGFWLTTPYPEFTLAAGEEGSFSLTLRNSGLPPQRATIEVKDLPSGWTSDVKGGGHPVTAAMVARDDTQGLTLDVKPPADAKTGTYKFEVDAHYGDQTASLPLALTLSAQKPGGIKLEPELPALRGTPTTTFDYRVKITNDSAKDALFNLAADVPDGFQTTFKHGYDTAEITGVPIKAGNNDTITLEVKPNHGVAAGKYPITLKVLAGNLSASTNLGLEVTGSPDLSLAGPQQRLSGEAVAGEAATFPFTVSNTGSAPAQNIKFSSSAPSDWTVTFDPDNLAALPAGQDQQVQVKITPSSKAIAGDYVVNVSAAGDGTSESQQFRVTVNTSTWWGIVGLIVIAIAAIILVLAVLRYGRR